jgi:hypothetical protein
MRRWSRWVVVLMPIVALGCASRRVVPLGLEPRRLPATTWVVVKSGERVELRNGYVGRDSVVGLRAQLRRAIPRDSVVSVEEPGGPSPAPLIMLGALALGAAVLIMSGGPAEMRSP